MSITTTQARTTQAIVNIFETGQVLGDYGNVTLIAGDTGHLSFGRSQTTLGSGGLQVLLERYSANAGARFGRRLQGWAAAVAARDTALDHDHRLHNVLRATADDPVMRDTQDEFFDQGYFMPAMRAAGETGIDEPLGRAVVYDSFVHGSWQRVRDMVAGTPAARGERAWIGDYVRTRRNWLATHPRADIRPTVYRMDALQRLIDLGLWGLELPLVVRGAEISSVTLAAAPAGAYDGPQPGTRALMLETTAPLARGLDVRLVQLAMSDRGLDIRADGVFGRASALGIAEVQRDDHLRVTGVADPTLVARLAADALQA